MASLDRLEGDAIEGGILLVLVLVAVAAWGIWKTAGKLDPVAALQKVWDAIKAAFAPSGGQTWGRGSDRVSLGSGPGFGTPESQAAANAAFQASLVDAVDSGSMTLGEYEQYSGGY
jgi:hypothetical protein